MNVTLCFVEVYRQNETLHSSNFSNTVSSVKHKNQDVELCSILHASNSMSDTYQYSIHTTDTYADVEESAFLVFQKKGLVHYPYQPKNEMDCMNNLMVLKIQTDFYFT